MREIRGGTESREREQGRQRGERRRKHRTHTNRRRGRKTQRGSERKKKKTLRKKDKQNQETVPGQKGTKRKSSGNLEMRFQLFLLYYGVVRVVLVSGFNSRFGIDGQRVKTEQS